MKTTVKVDGLSEILATMEAIGANVKAIHRRVGRKALQPFDAAWRSKVRERTGALKDSGGVGSKLSRSQRKLHTRDSTVEIFAGPGPLPQAITEEFGTVDQVAHPAVRPAWDEKKDGILPGLGADYWEEIEKTAKRKARKAAKAAAVEGGE